MVRTCKRAIMVSIIIVLFVYFPCVLSQDDNEEVLSPITLEQVNEAAKEAMIAVQAVDDLETELRRRGLVTRRGSASSFHQSLFRGDAGLLNQSRWGGLVETETAKSLINRLQIRTIRGRNQINRVSLNDTLLQEACPKPPTCMDTRYRSLDGSCNNLDNLSWGTSFTALHRLVDPSYDDGINRPRQVSLDGGPLPNPRLVSSRLSTNMNLPSERFTSILMQWGQFLDHDLSNTALSTASEGFGITCCNEEVRRNASLLHPACFPITIPENDPFFATFSQNCMEFVRSSAAPRDQCTLGQRQQLNMLTSFIDGSMIYGSTFNESLRLRSFEGGKLRSSDIFGANILPGDAETGCAAREDEPPCFLAGDARVNEQTLLSVFHHIWFREHNRIAGILARLNRGWNDEILYQETRRIVGAMIQHITYNEFLPILLGQRTMAAFFLNLQRTGMNYDYNKKINPAISNVFATAAYRLGHSLVQGNIPLVSTNNQVVDNLNLSTQYFNPIIAYTENAFDMIVRGLAAQPAQSFDHYMTDQLTNHLFQPPGQNFGLDLLSLNIQRGRDHGLPNYNTWREFCNLTRIESFEQLATIMNSTTVDIFRQLYRNVQDLDLYPAGISETPIRRDAVLPPTFSCLVAEQFRRLKLGDRFWYENGERENSFSESQVDEIRKVTLSRVLCDNSNVQAIQRNAFLVPRPRNPVERCIQGNIPRMSLDPWQNEPVWS